MTPLHIVRTVTCKRAERSHTTIDVKSQDYGTGAAHLRQASGSESGCGLSKRAKAKTEPKGRTTKGFIPTF